MVLNVLTYYYILYECISLVLWHIEPLLDNDRKTSDEIMAVARQQLHKYAIILEILLGSCPRASVEVLLEAALFIFPLPDS
jgi:hypothetical protein